MSGIGGHPPPFQPQGKPLKPGTLSSTVLLMDGNGETTNHFLNKDLVHHPTETTIKKWMFTVPGSYSIPMGWMVRGVYPSKETSPYERAARKIDAFLKVLAGGKGVMK